MANKDPYHISEEDFFQKVEIPFEKSKEEVWASMFENIEEQEVSTESKAPTKVIRMPWLRMVAAAAMILLVGTIAFMRFYTVSVYTNNAEFATHILPDASVVELNAASSLSYHPYWWGISRKVKFEGEGFFEVEKGSTFKVVSQKGMTEVLGTSFNINTRNDHYQVYCKTGKVKVSNQQGEHKAQLTPNMMLDFQEKFRVKPAKESNILSWKEGRFNFDSQGLEEVLAELERQYDISIKLDAKVASLKYTGYFKKTDTVEKALNLICQSFGFTFVKEGDKKYLISSKK